MATLELWAQAFERHPLTIKDVLQYASEAHVENDRYRTALNRLEGKKAGGKLDLAVYFAPGQTEIDRVLQAGNLRRLADAILSMQAADRKPVTIVGQADYSQGSKMDTAANRRIAEARARALKLALLQMDNRIVASRLLTESHVQDSTEAAAQILGQVPEKTAKDVSSGLLVGARAGSRASGILIPPTIAIASTVSLTAKSSHAQSIGISPIQWAAAATGVVASRAESELRLYAFERAAETLCTGNVKNLLPSTCSFLFGESVVRDELAFQPTLSSVSTMLQADMSMQMPHLVQTVLGKSTVPRRDVDRTAMLLGMATSIATQVEGGRSPLTAIARLAQQLPQTQQVELFAPVVLVLASYVDGETELPTEGIEAAARPDTVFLYAARAAMLNSQGSIGDSERAKTLMSTATEVIEIAKGLEASLTKTTEANAHLTARDAAANVSVYLRLVVAATALPKSEIDRIEPMLLAGEGVLSSARAGNLRATFLQLARLTEEAHSTWGSENQRLEWRVLAFVTDISDATDVQSAEDAINRFVGLGQGVIGKKQGTAPQLRLNAYLGGMAGYRSGGKASGGFFLPIGIEYGWPRGGGEKNIFPYRGFLLFPVDLGAIAALRYTAGDGSSEVDAKQLLSPGLAMVWSLGRRMPVGAGVSAQYQNGSADRQGWTLGVFAAADVPLIP